MPDDNATVSPRRTMDSEFTLGPDAPPQFASEAAACRRDLAEHFAAREFDDLRMRAHNLRTTFSNRGLTDLSEVATELERACLSRNIDQLGDAVARALDCLDRHTF